MNKLSDDMTHFVLHCLC